MVLGTKIEAPSQKSCPGVRKLLCTTFFWDIYICTNTPICILYTGQHLSSVYNMGVYKAKNKYEYADKNKVQIQRQNQSTNTKTITKHSDKN